MLRIHFAVLALFVVARAHPKSGDTQIKLHVGLNSTGGEACSFTLQQVIASILMVKSGNNPVPKPKRDDYEYIPGVGAYKLHTRALIWSEARHTCMEEGGHLAIVNSQAEADVLKKLFEKSGPIRGTQHPDFAALGFHDFYKEGEYVTIFDESLERAGYTRFAEGQPDNADPGEDCGSLHRSGGLNDIWCHEPIAFICELPEVFIPFL